MKQPNNPMEPSTILELTLKPVDGLQGYNSWVDGPDRKVLKLLWTLRRLVFRGTCEHEKYQNASRLPVERYDTKGRLKLIGERCIDVWSSCD